MNKLEKENEQLQAQVQYLRRKMGEKEPTLWVSDKEIEFMRYVSNHRIMPSYKVVAMDFGWSSHNSVWHKVKQLNRKGFMKKSDHGWVLTQAGKEMVEMKENLN